MFAKIFESIYDGTLAEDWRALITFQQLLILSDAQGTVDMTPAAIARRTGIPLDIIEAGIEALERPDPYSRSPEMGGARIARLDEHREWGWFLVNHDRYRDRVSLAEKRDADRKRIAARRAGERNKGLSQHVAASRKVSRPVADVAHTETETETEEKQTNFVRSSSADDAPEASGVPPCPHQDIIAAYHEILPMLPGVREWTPARRTALAARWREKPERQTIAWWRKLFSYVGESDFLTGRVSRGRGHDAWQCSLPWLLKPENFAKLLEGHYENREVAA